jgi:hypothetical protein
MKRLMMVPLIVLLAVGGVSTVSAAPECVYQRDLDTFGNDGILTIQDITAYLVPDRHYGTVLGDPLYDSALDHDRDGAISLADIVPYLGNMNTSPDIQLRVIDAVDMAGYEVALDAAPASWNWTGTILPAAVEFESADGSLLAKLDFNGNVHNGDGLLVSYKGADALTVEAVRSDSTIEAVAPCP